MPLRAQGQDPRVPAPGDGSFEWRGMLPHSYWPHVVDPAQGWVASWNNRAALDFPDSGDGTVWGPNQRVLGIQRDLSARLARGPIDAAGLAQVMQGIGSHDLRSLLFFRDILVRLQQPGAPHLTDAAREALGRVASWNGDMYFPNGSGPSTVKDPGATVFGLWVAGKAQQREIGNDLVCLRFRPSSSVQPSGYRLMSLSNLQVIENKKGSKTYADGHIPENRTGIFTEHNVCRLFH